MADLGTYNNSYSGMQWLVNHSLGTKDVAVDCFIYTGSPQELEKAIPETQTTSTDNQVIIDWSESRTGAVRVVAGGDD